jgi:hypothetical protein
MATSTYSPSATAKTGHATPGPVIWLTEESTDEEQSMKAGTAALVIAYSFLYRYRHLLSGSLAFCAVSHEETGGK